MINASLLTSIIINLIKVTFNNVCHIIEQLIVYDYKYKNNYKKLFRKVGMAVPKRKGTRAVGWWLLM